MTFGNTNHEEARSRIQKKSNELSDICKLIDQYLLELKEAVSSSAEESYENAIKLYEKVEAVACKIDDIEKQIKVLKLIEPAAASFLRFHFANQRKQFLEYCNKSNLKKNLTGAFVFTDGRDLHQYGLLWLWRNLLFDLYIQRNYAPLEYSEPLNHISLRNCTTIDELYFQFEQLFQLSHFDEENFLKQVRAYTNTQHLVLVIKDIEYWNQFPELWQAFFDNIWNPICEKIQNPKHWILLFLLDENRQFSPHDRSIFTEDLDIAITLNKPWIMEPVDSISLEGVHRWVDKETSEVEYSISLFRSPFHFLDCFNSYEQYKTCMCPKKTTEGFFIQIAKKLHLLFHNPTNRRWIINTPKEN